jgi:hypothetical protein
MGNPVKSVQDPCAGNGHVVVVSIMEMRDHDTAVGRATLVTATVLEDNNTSKEHVFPVPPLVSLRAELTALLRDLYGPTTDVLFA